MTWVELGLSRDRTGRSTSEGLKRLGLVRRQKRQCGGTSRNGVKSRRVRPQSIFSHSRAASHKLGTHTGFFWSYTVRVLQYRSVAFVTYANEYNAQFAKEAMACQSLDNDEILNVRWATEDPNPTSKVAEKRRLEEMGREAIQARMDPKILQAERQLKALEDGVVLEDDEEDYDEQNADEMDVQREAEDEDDTPDLKRRRIEPPPPQETQPPLSTGLLSADTLEGLKYFAEIRKRTGGPSVATAKPTATPVGISLGDYGSDDDD